MCDAGYDPISNCKVKQCPRECSGNGDCVDSVCNCYLGWGGLSCNIPLPMKNDWSKINSKGDKPGGRVFHGMVADETGRCHILENLDRNLYQNFLRSSRIVPLARAIVTLLTLWNVQESSYTLSAVTRQGTVTPWTSGSMTLRTCSGRSCPSVDKRRR